MDLSKMIETFCQFLRWSSKVHIHFLQLTTLKNTSGIMIGLLKKSYQCERDWYKTEVCQQNEELRCPWHLLTG